MNLLEVGMEKFLLLSLRTPDGEIGSPRGDTPVRNLTSPSGSAVPARYHARGAWSGVAGRGLPQELLAAGQPPSLPTTKRTSRHEAGSFFFFCAINPSGACCTRCSSRRPS